MLNMVFSSTLSLSLSLLLIVYASTTENVYDICRVARLSHLDDTDGKAATAGWGMRGYANGRLNSRDS